MRTTLDIDDRLLDALQARLPRASKTEAIEAAIASFVERGAAERLTELAGRMEIDDLSRQLRDADRHT